ncbi:MAG: hypothetical protein OXC95_04815 [Dehalococcoidia bacterium]|nr:hypothetical protein [Dehalococcoidia bacterium]
MDLELGIVIAIIAAILSPPLTVGVPLAIFQWRQNAALDRRLSNEIKTVKEDLSDEIKASENRLNRRIDDVEDRLSADIKAVENRFNRRIDEVEERLTTRINTTDNNVIHLIGEVGLVKGAVLGISTEGAPREPVTPN